MRISISVCESNRSDRTPKVARVLGVEKGNSGVCKADIQQRKQACAMLEIEMALQRGRLPDLVPEVLDVAVPELADLSLFRRSRCAVNEPETFDFVEHLSIKIACECRRRIGTELVGPLQRKRRHLRPLGKIRRREVRRRQLVVSGLVTWDVRRWNYIGSIRAARSAQLAGNCLPHGYSLSFSLIIGNLGQVLL